MNFVNSRCLFVVFVYFSAAVLVIVDGQSTTDDDTDNYEISKLIDAVTELRAELREEQFKSANAIADLKSQLKNKGKAKYVLILT